MTSKIWRGALGAVKDQTSIGLVKVGSTTALADLDVAIVKATKHNEAPNDEKYVREILSLTSYSRSHVNSCVSAISHRLNRTRSWTVALKSLVLIQRLLQEGDLAYEQEIFFSTRRGTRLLNMSDFRDASTANSWDFSAFVKTHALYLDEKLEYKMLNKREEEEAHSGMRKKMRMQGIIGIDIRLHTGIETKTEEKTEIKRETRIDQKALGGLPHCMRLG